MDSEKIQPWYRQFWFWFVFAPLILVICVSMVTVTIAFRHADDVVIDNYYKEGKAINQKLDEDRRAYEMHLSAHLRFDRVTGEIFVTIANQQALPDQLLLLLAHPFEADLDQDILLKRVSDGRYRGELQRKVDYSWYLSLLPISDKAKRDDAEWLLSGEINFAHGEEIDLKPRVKQ